jgi:hypothetical protein
MEKSRYRTLAGFPNPPEVARRIEQKQANASVQLSIAAMPVAGGFAAYAGPCGYVNRACAMGLDGPVTDEEIASVVH